MYIYKTFPINSSMWYLHCVWKHLSFLIYACALSDPLFLRFRAIWWYALVRDAVKHYHWNSTQVLWNMALAQSTLTCEFYEFTKGNGFKYTLIAPPLIEQRSETFCLNFWAFFFKAEESNYIKKSLARFLSRKTPNSDAGQTIAIRQRGFARGLSLLQISNQWTKRMSETNREF